MNRNPIERLFGQTLLYGISSVLVRSLSYLLIPLYTSVFDPAQYGIVIEMFAYMALLNILFTFGLETSFFRFASVEGREDQVFRCTQTLLILVATVCASLLFAVSEPLARMMDYPGRGSLISMATAILLIDACVAIPFARLRLQGKPFIFAGFKLGHVTCNLLLNLFFFLLLPRVVSALPSEPIGLLRNFDPGVEYIFISNLCSSAVFLFLFIPSLRKLRIDFSLGGRILRYALPIVLVGMAGVTVDVFSRMTLKYLLPPDFYPSRTSQEILGIFGVCYKLSVMMTLFTQAFRYAYEPFFFRERTGVGAPAQNARAMHAFVVVGVIGWLLLTTFLDVVGDVLLRDESYREGLPIVPILLCNGLMLGIYYNLSVWYKGHRQQLVGGIYGSFRDHRYHCVTIHTYRSSGVRRERLGECDQLDLFGAAEPPSGQEVF